MKFLPDNSGNGSENEEDDEDDSDDNSDSHSTCWSTLLWFVEIGFLFILRWVNQRSKRFVFQVKVVPEIIEENDDFSNCNIKGFTCNFMAF